MMTIAAHGSALDYLPCRYGSSRAVFRGPARDLTLPYAAMLGGSSTFGKYVARPYPALVEQSLGRPVVNLGALNAGADFYLADPPALNIAARARAAVVELAGAEALSNPFYTVHSRRNDRFLAATPALRALYPEVDVTDIHFTRHLLQVLHRTDPERFARVVSGLQTNWVARMRQLLLHLPPRRLLLWLADAPPPDTAFAPEAAGGPLFVNATMVRALWPAVSGLVFAMPGPATRARGVDGMMFPEIEATQAALLPGPAQHAEVAAQLAQTLARLF
jgi:Domain of unknown function (DUF6473)